MLPFPFPSPYSNFPASSNSSWTHVLMVNASDSGGLFCVFTVWVRVFDVNDNPPQFVNLHINPVPEDTPVGSVVGKLHAVDPDVSKSRSAQFSLFHYYNPFSMPPACLFSFCTFIQSLNVDEGTEAHLCVTFIILPCWITFIFMLWISSYLDFTKLFALAECTTIKLRQGLIHPTRLSW
ncbi:unnamed protein product [Protopolystoma xenopodis]|uniref:Cadherin domain-containing protein n=1 Tax=Protopolystoma xenopodis TaxID=117903 RepID=A0A448WSI0_9PLAT|nr:unnamed protein product [Protopolystoma xenopodis]